MQKKNVPVPSLVFHEKEGKIGTQILAQQEIKRKKGMLVNKDKTKLHVRLDVLYCVR